MQDNQTCKVVFQNGDSDQKLIVDFKHIDDDLNFNVTFEPALESTDQNLGLAGGLLNEFITAITNPESN